MLWSFRTRSWWYGQVDHDWPGTVGTFQCSRPPLAQFEGVSIASVYSRVQNTRARANSTFASAQLSKWEIYEFLIFAFTYLRLDTFILRIFRLRPLALRPIIPSVLHTYFEFNSEKILKQFLCVCFKSDLWVDDWDATNAFHMLAIEPLTRHHHPASGVWGEKRECISIRKCAEWVCNLHAMEIE